MSPRTSSDLIAAFQSWRRSIGDCTAILLSGARECGPFLRACPAPPVNDNNPNSTQSGGEAA